MKRPALQIAWWIGAYTPPDRRLLRDIILPYYATHEFRRVLFVGTRFYTRRYERRFRRGAFRTIDADPRMAKHGSKDHIVDRIEALGAHVRNGSLDAIIMNGVIGWGVNSISALDAALDACLAALRPGGHLVLGVNELLTTTPHVAGARAMGSAQDGFDALRFAPLDAHQIVVPTPFAEREHTYSFWIRRAGR